MYREMSRLLINPRVLPGFLVLLAISTTSVRADAPVASYLFPAGGRQGAEVNIRLGGLNLHQRCSFEMLGRGIEADKELNSVPTLWFEGPLLPLPESQQAEDYPKDMTGRVRIAADAVPGIRHARIWNSQGACPSLPFMIGTLPEVLEHEIDGDPIPVKVSLPVTANGRIFPREDVDIWSFTARKGQSITCEVHAARLASPLDAIIKVVDPNGRTIGESDDAFGSDPMIRFNAPADGEYQVRIHDVNSRGGPAYVYRLTLTSEPRVERVYPLGGRRGSETSFEISGQSLDQSVAKIALPADGPVDYQIREVNGLKINKPVLLELDDLPEYVENEPNDEPAQVKPVAVPGVFNGRIGRPGDRDLWAFTARKGEVLEFDLRSARLGSPLHAVVRWHAETGASSPTVMTGLDNKPYRFTAANDGTYYITIEERFRERGGPGYAYRLRINRPSTPDFKLRFASDALTVNRGGQAKFKVFVDRQVGFTAPVTLSVTGLPPGVTVANTTIAANQAFADLQFKADKSASIHAQQLTIQATATIGDKTSTRIATLPGLVGESDIDTVLLAVALPTPFQIKGEHDMRWTPRGTMHHRHYQIERGGFTGPLEVRIADRQARHLQGVTGPVVTVPSGADEFDYTVQLPPWMEMGRTCRVVVSATGIVKDTDGREHAVCFSSVQVNEQIITVVGPERLRIDVDKSFVTIAPGKLVNLPIRIVRGKDLQGPVRLELLTPSHMHCITANSITIPADQSATSFSIHLSANAQVALNAPVVIRATMQDKNEPVIAEAKLQIEPER